MKYIIKGKGGQGVLFLGKVIANALLLSKIENFTFLKEFDEGQRKGEIQLTFTLPFDLPNKKLVVRKHNMIELKKAVKDLKLTHIKKALKIVKPKAFNQNLKIYEEN